MSVRHARPTPPEAIARGHSVVERRHGARAPSAGMPHRHGLPEAVRPILQRALDRHAVGRRLPRRIAPETWAAAVGAQIAARAQPTVLSKGTLHVLVEDHRWRDQLDAARNFLIERINERLGAPLVSALQFGLAHAGTLDAARRRAGLVPPAPTPPIEPGRVLGDARLDGALREAVLRLAEAAARKASA